MAKFDLKKAIVTLKSGGSPGSTLQIKVGEGTVNISEKRNREYVLDRGLLDTVRDGDEVPLDVRFDIIWEFLRSDSGDPITPREFITQTYAGSSLVSSADDPCEPYAIDIEIVYSPVCENVATEVILIRDFRYEDIAMDAKAGTLAVSGKANVTMPSITRV